MSKKAGTKVVILTLAGILKGQDKVFRGHKFIKGKKVMCCDDNRLAAILNSFRHRLPVEEPEIFEDSNEGLVAYKEYCEKAGIPIDPAAIHNLGKAKGQVDLGNLNEDPEDDDLDKELAELVAQGEANGVDDEPEDDEPEDEEPENEPEVLNGVEVDPAVTRENQLRAALGMLDHSNPDHWTSTGLPKMDVVEELVGDDVSRKELNTYFPDFVRNH